VFLGAKTRGDKKTRRGSRRNRFLRDCESLPVSQLMFGSDFPFSEGIEASEGLAAYTFGDADRVSINSGTALNLMPNLAA
jgi:hypothetical protein